MAGAIRKGARAFNRHSNRITYIKDKKHREKREKKEIKGSDKVMTLAEFYKKEGLL